MFDFPFFVGFTRKKVRGGFLLGWDGSIGWLGCGVRRKWARLGLVCPVEPRIDSAEPRAKSLAYFIDRIFSARENKIN